MSPDPYSGSYDFTNPQSLNRYAYVLNNPLAFVDPLGLDTSSCTDEGTDTTCIVTGDPGSSGGGGGGGEGQGGIPLVKKDPAGGGTGAPIKTPCISTKSLSWFQRAQLKAVQFYANLTGWTAGFGAGADAGAGIGPNGSSWNVGLGGSASTMIVADASGNEGFLNSVSGGISFVKMSSAGARWGAGAAAGPSILVAPNPISVIAGPSGSVSGGGGDMVGAGFSVTTSGAATLTLGVGAGVEAGFSPQFGTSQFIPFCIE